MLRSSLSIGDKIEVRLLNKKGNPLKNIEPYSSQLLDFLSDEIISIAMPLKQGETIMLEPGIHYNLCFITNKGLYRCNCQMIKSYKENNSLIAAVAITTELEKFQRRQYYRLEVVHEIEYCEISKDELDEIHKVYDKKIKDNLKEDTSSIEKASIIDTLVKWSKEWKTAEVIDISGGGVKFYSKERLERNNHILTKIDFNIKEITKNIVVGAKIIESSRIENRANLFFTRVEFTNINKKDREDLIKFIFEQERIIRKKKRY